MKPRSPTPRQRLAQIAFIIEQVENRCMAVDGPVTNTRLEMTDAELRRIWRLTQFPKRKKSK